MLRCGRSSGMSVRMPRTWDSRVTGPNFQWLAWSIYALSSLHYDSRKIPNSRLASLIAAHRAIRPPQVTSPQRGAPSHVTTRRALSLVASTTDIAVPLANGGASRDAVSLASWPCHCHTCELHAPPLTSILASSSIMMSLHSFQLQGNIALKAHVASVCFRCFRCFIWMLHVFYLEAAKSRSGCCTCCNGYVCCKCMFRVFHLFFQTYGANVFILMLYMFSHICRKCFIWMLHIF
jgi:hypothetical protein